MHTRTYHDALYAALAAEMEQQPRILYLSAGPSHEPFSLGERLKARAGAERVRHAECGAATTLAAAVGAALAGARVVVELAQPELLLQALEVLVRPGAARVPLVLRTRYTPQATLETALAHVPGLAVAMPSTPYDAVGLLRAALRQTEAPEAPSGPVLFLEPDALLQTSGEIPAEDYTLPLGSASIRRRGKDLSVIACGAMVDAAQTACERAASEEAIDAELIDLRTLRPLDADRVVDAVKRTGRILLVSDAPKTCNALNELVALIQERCFDDLDAPVQRCFGADQPPPGHPHHAAQRAPGTDAIFAALVALHGE